MEGDSVLDRKGQGNFVESLLRQFKYKREDFRVIGSFGGFTSLIDMGTFALSFNTDNVGTKIMIAEDIGKLDTIGIDCIAMCVNDAITAGSEPIAMVDYIQLRNADPEMARQIGNGLNVGAQIANVTLVGGETAIVPDLVNHVDLAGAAVGIVQKSQIINGEGISDGDIVFALQSSGLHSNGFTSVRSAIKKAGLVYDDTFPGDSKKTYEVLLEPTRIYVREVLDIMNIVNIKGMANITGGGVRNIVRMKDMAYVLDNPFEPQNVFNRIQEFGGYSMQQMFETFNMGMGFVIVIDEESKVDFMNAMRGRVPVREIGHVEKGIGISIPKYEVSFQGYY
ncbi:MAG: phosphoribosylformylglycinamidine cyclo-ligase [Candidatus Thermoplasmatota archaeon]|nr:phosphoribosylformylglycinamidine cyclo-ligase [Candidatus Thermoplasmatota archaeon]MCL5665386.1 phosphoribosylformylglycinamidine cyclo-ligase [Candidatus Thermoplasmatota archaeon]